MASYSIPPFGHNRYRPEIGGCAPLGEGGARSPSNTMWPGSRPTCTPSFIVIHRTVWPQYTNVTDRTNRQTERQRSDSTGRTALQTVAQKTRQTRDCNMSTEDILTGAVVDTECSVAELCVRVWNVFIVDIDCLWWTERLAMTFILKHLARLRHKLGP